MNTHGGCSSSDRSGSGGDATGQVRRVRQQTRADVERCDCAQQHGTRE